MFKKSLSLLIAGIVVLASAGAANAQNLDMSRMVQNELNFSNQFNQWAWKGSLETARYLRMTGQPNPFNATTLNQANRDLQRTYDAYNRAAQNNSNRTSNAIGNWTNGALRGNGPYYNPNTGANVNLPWTHNTYHINQYGQAVPGYSPYRTNIYPNYGR